jgi:hypothetical protein
LDFQETALSWIPSLRLVISGSGNSESKRIPEEGGQIGQGRPTLEALTFFRQLGGGSHSLLLSGGKRYAGVFGKQDSFKRHSDEIGRLLVNGELM